MEAIDFPNRNLLLGPPSPNSNVQNLPVFATGESFTSLWRLSDDDLMNIVKNRCIQLTIYGQGHPPVSLATIDPATYE